MPRWLYRYEAKGIQSYVLGTNRLVEIAGGSAIVEGLSELREKLCGELGLDAVEPYAAAAGGATLSFQSKADLEAFAEYWPMAVGLYAPGLQVIQAWAKEKEEKVDKDDKSNKALHEVIEKLRAARNRMEVSLPEAGPLMARSSRTGSPAVARAKKGAGLIDEATRRRAGEGRVIRNERVMEKRLLKETVWAKERFVTDHHEFGVSMLAVIHIDGNDMGKRVMGLESSEDYETFSRALTESTEAAARAAVQAVLAAEEAAREGDKGAREALPLRPIVVGGDDVTVITRAKDALRFVRAYIEAFQRETGQRAEELRGDAGLTACAGVVFVKVKTPFSGAYALSEELCGWTKKRLRGQGEGGATPSAVTFHRVTQGLHTSWEDVLKRELALSGKEGGMTAAPYVFGEVKGRCTLGALEALTLALGELPRGTVREWARVAQGDQGRADARWTRLLEVAKKEPGDRLKRALEGCGVRGEQPLGEAGTPIFDALTLRALGVGRRREDE